MGADGSIACQTSAIENLSEKSMSSDFDPYYLWLGIPPHEQPPNHYRLLGIAAFESNASVIDSAASRQSTYLHSVAAGPQRQASQKLLTEIAGARRTLLNAESKQVYDADLKTRLASSAPKPAAPPIARPVAVPVTAAVAAPVAVPVATPVTAPVAALVATPVAVPVAAPVAVPVAVPVATPVAAPIAKPIAVAVAAPIADPFAVIAEPAEQEPMANLFGDFAEESSREVEPGSLPAATISPSPTSPPAAIPAARPPSKRLMWMVGGGVGVLALILAFVFRPRGNDKEATASAPKNSTSKKAKTSTPSKAKPTESSNNEPAAVAAVAAAANTPRLIRYIRIELPRKGVLSLAEVEALHFDKRNVASYGTAEQSTTEGRGAALAIDGNISGKLSDNTQSLTRDSDNPWWQLDLGGAYPLEKIVIHNLTDPGLSERMAGYTLLLMDNNRRPLAELKDQPAPNPRSEFVVSTMPAASMTLAPAKAKPRKKT